MVPPTLGVWLPSPLPVIPPRVLTGPAERPRTPREHEPAGFGGAHELDVRAPQPEAAVRPLLVPANVRFRGHVTLRTAQGDPYPARAAEVVSSAWRASLHPSSSDAKR
jgi:hypothetical protein